MEIPFSAAQEAMANQIRNLELHCNDVLSTLQDENNSLRKALSEAKVTLPLLPDEQQPLFKLSNSYQAPGKILPCLSHCPKHSDIAQPWTPCGSPRPWSSPSQTLCVTPGRSNGVRRNQASLQIARQPAEDFPVAPVLTVQIESEGTRTVQTEGLGTPSDFIGTSCSPASSLMESSLLLAFGNLVDIMSLGGKEIIDNNPFNRWALLFAGITIPKESRHWLRVKTQERRLGLRPVWTRALKSKSYGHLSRVASKVSHFRWSVDSVCVGSTIKSKNSRWQRFTVHPDHKLSWAHAVFQGLLILFDVIDFPLSAFHSGQAEYSDVMLLVSTAFWTWDICLSFLQGFHTKDGVIEMRPHCIAWHYLRRWFLFDLVVAALDWVSLFIFIYEKEPDTGARVARATKFRRISRIVRGGRIVRLAKAFERAHALLDATASAEWVVMIARIFGLVVMILLINHYVACAWYAIAESNRDPVTWITVQMIEHADGVDKYFYSLHWALTQFTPCTNNIAPANGRERFFASVVVLFALVVFSAFLSSLTTAIMQIKKLNFERYSEEVLIREFMVSKKVPLSVANQVWHFFRKHYRLRNKIVAETDVPFFAIMPKSLRRELRTLVYIPTLTRYPVLKELIEDPICPLGPQLCEVVRSLIPVSGHDIFLEGDLAEHMYFFVSGAGNYVRNGETETVRAPTYVSEAVLWLTFWQHRGRLTASGNRCELLVLEVVPVLTVIENETSDFRMRSLRKYASLYAQYLEDIEVEASMNKRMPLEKDGNEKGEEWHTVKEIYSDLPIGLEVCTDMTVKAFGMPLDTQLTTSGPSMGSQLQTFWRRFGSTILKFGRRDSWSWTR